VSAACRALIRHRVEDETFEGPDILAPISFSRDLVAPVAQHRDFRHRLRTIVPLSLGPERFFAEIAPRVWAHFVGRIGVCSPMKALSVAFK